MLGIISPQRHVDSETSRLFESITDSVNSEISRRIDLIKQGDINEIVDYISLLEYAFRMSKTIKPAK